MRRIWGIVFFVLSMVGSLRAQQLPMHTNPQLAALALPTAAAADWRQWDSFLTTVIKKLGQDLSEQQRDQLRELFLDSRYQLVEAFSSGVSDPVPGLFRDAWGRLSPILKQGIAGLPQQTAGQYQSFISAMDSLASLSGLGQSLGLFRVTPDALRGASKLLGIGDVDPLAYTLEVDSALRGFLGLSDSLPSPRLSPAIEQGSFLPRRFTNDPKALAGLRSWFIASAFAADDDFDRLNQWVPEAPELQDYLIEVRRLLTRASDAVLGKSKLATQYQTLYRQIVFAAAWQESCWRQFIKKGEKLTPVASATGDLGMMQVNRNTWRGVYDLKGLGGDIEYNSQAGSEILLYYLSRFAIPKKEDKQPGGHLARATYSAYNGGPRQLRRYRNPKTRLSLKKVDDAFWKKFQTVSAGEELAVRSCYGQ